MRSVKLLGQKILEECNSSDSESKFGFYAEDVANIPSQVTDEIRLKALYKM